ncbi:MAG: hypothetical protein GY757_25140 [bacterium]|nr:hypothetical protein [bacterium]
MDEYYKTARGAKIAFLKYFKYRLKTSAETDKAKKIRKDKREWTPAFYPDKGWLFQKFGLLSPLMQSNAFRTFRIVQRGFRLMVNSKYMAPPHRKGGPSRRVAARKPPVPRYHYGVTAKVRI